jgi:hypothetical protein
MDLPNQHDTDQSLTGIVILFFWLCFDNKDPLTFFIRGGYVLRQSKERSCKSLSPFPPRKMGGCMRTLALTPWST